MALKFRGPSPEAITLKVNGKAYNIVVEPNRTLLSVLREELELTGAKRGCGHGQCGACTVILDGETVYSCITLAYDCADKDIRTIEGLTEDDSLHPVQTAFIEKDGYQCGFCTPGQIMSAVSLLEHDLHPTQDDILREMGGNICRCGAYPNILKAVMAAADTMAAEED